MSLIPKKGTVYVVADVNTEDGAVGIEIANPDFNPKKKVSEENTENILVDVFFDEIRPADDDEGEAAGEEAGEEEEAPEEAVEEAPRRGRAAGRSAQRAGPLVIPQAVIAAAAPRAPAGAGCARRRGMSGHRSRIHLDKRMDRVDSGGLVLCWCGRDAHDCLQAL